MAMEVFLQIKDVYFYEFLRTFGWVGSNRDRGFFFFHIFSLFYVILPCPLLIFFNNQSPCVSLKALQCQNMFLVEEKKSHCRSALREVVKGKDYICEQGITDLNFRLLISLFLRTLHLSLFQLTTETTALKFNFHVDFSLISWGEKNIKKYWTYTYIDTFTLLNWEMWLLGSQFWTLQLWNSNP